jgi:SAM-dependent methyltransferase
MADRFPSARSVTVTGGDGAEACAERFDPATMNGLIAADHLARYWLAARLTGGLEVLDAGCGMGYGAEMIARAGASRVAGIDLAPEAIAAASERAGEVAEFQVGDVSDPPFEGGSFDVVVCFEVLEHLEDPEPAITALKGVLRQGGLLIASSPNRGVYPPGNPHHLHEFTLEELRDSLQARFANVVVMRQHPWLASLIDNGTLGSPGDEPVMASIASADKPADSWTYVVALASDGAIDEPGPISVLAETGELRSLREAIGTAEARYQTLHDASERLRGDRDLLCKALMTANQDRGRLRGAFQAVQRDLHEAERHLRELEGSTSWRITRPLRAASDGLRRLSQRRPASPKRGA